jgi:hypothetical protein
MFDVSSLIGYNLQEAVDILKENGLTKINIIENIKHHELCDNVLVCGVKQAGNEVTLICGEFYLDIKE